MTVSEKKNLSVLDTPAHQLLWTVEGTKEQTVEKPKSSFTSSTATENVTGAHSYHAAQYNNSAVMNNFSAQFMLRYIFSVLPFVYIVHFAYTILNMLYIFRCLHISDLSTYSACFLQINLLDHFNSVFGVT